MTKKQQAAQDANTNKLTGYFGHTVKFVKISNNVESLDAIAVDYFTTTEHSASMLVKEAHVISESKLAAFTAANIPVSQYNAGGLAVGGLDRSGE
jgi:hypothetical protein